MTDHEGVEQQIKTILAQETSAVLLSEQLFSVEGLFNRLASTEEERRQVATSTLFRQAQARFRELREQEARAFVQAIEQAQASVPLGEHLIKRERAPGRS